MSSSSSLVIETFIWQWSGLICGSYLIPTPPNPLTPECATSPYPTPGHPTPTRHPPCPMVGSPARLTWFRTHTILITKLHTIFISSSRAPRWAPSLPCINYRQRHDRLVATTPHQHLSALLHLLINFVAHILPLGAFQCRCSLRWEARGRVRLGSPHQLIRPPRPGNLVKKCKIFATGKTDLSTQQTLLGLSRGSRDRWAGSQGERLSRHLHIMHGPTLNGIPVIQSCRGRLEGQIPSYIAISSDRLYIIWLYYDIRESLNDDDCSWRAELRHGPSIC